jgi:hypothetical protein
MAGKTLTQLILLARQSADMENDPLCDDTEVTTYLNDGLRDLYLAYTKYYTDAYLLLQTPIVVASGATTAPLPANYLKSRGVDWWSGNRWYPLLHFTWRERGSYHSGRRAHRIDTVIRLDPVNLDLSGTYQLWYYPTAPVLVNPTDVLDVLMDQWSDFVVNYAAAHMLTKAKLDNSSQTGAMSYVLDKLSSEAQRRDSEPEQAPDVDSDSAWCDPAWGF